MTHEVFTFKCGEKPIISFQFLLEWLVIANILFESLLSVFFVSMLSKQNKI